MNKPKDWDLVLGGQTPNLSSSLVLGGIEGIKKQLTSDSEEVRCEALYRAVGYQEKGKAVIIKALQDPIPEVRWTAYRLLMIWSKESIPNISSFSRKQSHLHTASRIQADKEALKTHLEEELGEYSNAIIGTDFPLDLGIRREVESADIIAMFPSGYMVALMIVTEPINSQEISLIWKAFLNKGIDVMWWLGGEGDTTDNRDLLLSRCGCTYMLKSKNSDSETSNPGEIELRHLNRFDARFCKMRLKQIDLLLEHISDENWQGRLIEEEEILKNVLENGHSLEGLGQAIFGRALKVTFHTWRRLNNNQLKRGLAIQNKGTRSFGGNLGSLSSHNHHSRVTAIAKRQKYWEVTDDNLLMDSTLGFQKDLFPGCGIKAIKERAHTIAKIKELTEDGSKGQLSK
jgi:hypothetical protein